VEETGRSKNKVIADAYLFDAVLIRGGKTTSFRLELYVNETIVGLAGRGYLGKGALRGVMNARHLRVYFPSTNEFVDDTFEALLSDSTCPLTLQHFDPIRYLSILPDSIMPDSQISVICTKSGDTRMEYAVSSGCDWELSLAYDRRGNVWRPVEIGFVTTGGTTLKATRREFRPGSKVPATKFADPVPSGALRLPR
jgi:hypothetical protein